MTLTPEQREMAREAGIIDPAKAEAFIDKIKQGKEATSALGDQMLDSFSVLDQVNEWISKAGTSLDELGNLTGADAVKFGVLTSAIAGARKEFEGFASVSKGSAIGTFGDSMSSLIGTVKQQGTALNLASGAGKQLLGVLTNMGAGAKAFSIAMQGGGRALAAFAENFLTSADNALRFQNGMFDAMAAGGNLNEFLNGTERGFSGIGKGLEGLNR